MLLDLVGIDAKRFLEVFIKYDNHTTSDNVDYIIDNTTLIKGNKLFKTFMDSVIGYNYILVHKIGKEIHYYDLRKQENTDKFIGKVISSKIYYGGRQGKGKRVDVVIETTWLKLNINFRSKDGTIYPTHIMCNYIIK